jgi:uncharacterized Zn finger protein
MNPTAFTCQKPGRATGYIRMSEVAEAELEQLQTAIRRRWSRAPSKKATPYVNAFTTKVRSGAKISANVVGNHGIYTVSIQLDAKGLTSACSCYIGKHGNCHHCEALAHTFIQEPSPFKVIKPKQRKDVRNLTDVQAYLRSVTLDDLLGQLKAKGITQKAFAEQIGMNPRHLTAIKSSELRHHYFNELGATKLACLWVLEQVGKAKRR